MYFHRNNIRNKNIEMKKVPRKGPMNALTTKRFIFFIRGKYLKAQLHANSIPKN
jgi:hypothetical protein